MPRQGSRSLANGIRTVKQLSAENSPWLRRYAWYAETRGDGDRPLCDNKKQSSASALPLAYNNLLILNTQL